MIRIVHFQRKPLPIHKSVEFIFADLRKRLPANFEAVHLEYANYSKGLFPRLMMLWETFQSKGHINHVTGDVHFVTLALPQNRTILTILDCVALNESKGVKHIVFKWLWFLWPLKHVRYVTAISESTKNQIIQHTQFPADRIFVIPVAVSELFVYSPKIFHKEKPILLQVGTTPNKNIERLIEAIQGLTCELWIIGQISQDILVKLEEYKIDFKNYTQLSIQEVVDCYKQSDLLCFVSTYEGFGMPIVEANALGRAVITSNITSMPEVAGDAALLVDPFNVAAIRKGIVDLIENDHLRETFILSGLENAKRFDPNTIALQYAALYKRLDQEFKN